MTVIFTQDRTKSKGYGGDKIGYFHEELDMYLRGAGWAPIFVEGDDPARMHRLMADALDEALDKIAEFQTAAREEGAQGRPAWGRGIPP